MITVILATWNGARSLEPTLAAFARLKDPGVPWRLIVVDNGSTDRTPRLLEAYAGRLPMTILREPSPGKSRAVNLALDHVCEGLVVFADDDIVPDDDWLLQYETVSGQNPDYALFAGRIRPQWEVAPPAWLRDWDELDSCYGIHVERPEGLCPSYLLYGGNMAIRAEAIGATRFDESYGPFQDPAFAMCGETEFVGRLAAVGSKAWFCRNAVARHRIPAEHMEMEWLLNRAGNFGRGQFRVGADPRYRSRSARWTLLALHLAMIATRWRGLGARLRGSTGGAFRAKWRHCYLAGFAAEARAAGNRIGGPGHRDAAHGEIAWLGALHEPDMSRRLEPRSDQANETYSLPRHERGAL